MFQLLISPLQEVRRPVCGAFQETTSSRWGFNARVGSRNYKDVFPGVTKVPCFLEALKYLKTSKQHPFETPGFNYLI